MIDESIDYFCIDDLRYRGHKLSAIYDKNGSRYKKGKGLTVFVDNRKVELIRDKNKYRIVIGPPVKVQSTKQPVNYALNIEKTGHPVASASVNSVTDSLYQAIDGRIWYFPEITNRWTTQGSASDSDWFAIDFGKAKEISLIKIYLFADGKDYAIPDRISITYHNGNDWMPVNLKKQQPATTLANTVNTFSIEKITASKIKINFKHRFKRLALCELECY